MFITLKKAAKDYRNYNLNVDQRRDYVLIKHDSVIYDTLVFYSVEKNSSCYM